MRKPIIAVTPQSTPLAIRELKVNLYSTLYDNADRFTERGAIPIIPSFINDKDAEELMAQCDGLFVTGGADVDPTLYGEEKETFCGDIQYDRDKSDLALIKAATKLKKPIMGVCRGSQFLNIFFGGTLYQDLPTQFNDTILHTDLPNIKKEDSHTVQIVKDSPLYKLLEEDTIKVNSSHHQGFKILGPKAIPMAYAPDGLIESFYIDDDSHWVRAYQWHPEMQDYNIHMDKILNDFIDACRKNMDK